MSTTVQTDPSPLSNVYYTGWGGHRRSKHTLMPFFRTDRQACLLARLVMARNCSSLCRRASSLTRAWVQWYGNRHTVGHAVASAGQSEADEQSIGEARLYRMESYCSTKHRDKAHSHMGNMMPELTGVPTYEWKKMEGEGGPTCNFSLPSFCSFEAMASPPTPSATDARLFMFCKLSSREVACTVSGHPDSTKV